MCWFLYQFIFHLYYKPIHTNESAMYHRLHVHQGICGCPKSWNTKSFNSDTSAEHGTLKSDLGTTMYGPTITHNHSYLANVFSKQPLGEEVHPHRKDVTGTRNHGRTHSWKSLHGTLGDHHSRVKHSGLCRGLARCSASNINEMLSGLAVFDAHVFMR